MRRTFIIVGTLILIALTLIVVKAAVAKSAASPEVVAELKADMERRQGLMHDRVIELLKTKAGQDALAEVAGEYDKLFYNGHKRFAIVSPISSGLAKHVVGLRLSEGEQDLSFPISYIIQLLNATMDDQFDIEFKSDSVIVTLISESKASEGKESKSVEINWPRGTLGPHGYYNFETGETDLDK